MLNPITLTQQLIQCPSVTPHNKGVLEVLEDVLKPLGFQCQRLPFQAEGTERVDNLYAKWGKGSPHFCFAGHVDVVPEGNSDDWQHNPYAAHIENGVLHGRGASDMKSAIACFICAVEKFIKNNPLGSISLLITGDEEGIAINGTKPMLEHLKIQGENWDACLVGEPTNPNKLGEMIKVGWRGSINATITVNGKQGHVAYPDRAENPIPVLLKILNKWTENPLDDGAPHFQPSNLEITTIDVANPTTNVIPQTATARINIRFNVNHSGESLKQWLIKTAKAIHPHCDFDIAISGESFLTQNSKIVDVMAVAVEKVTGRKPELSTSGGTSDARFITNYCPVVEFGIVGATMHQVDEQVNVADIKTLTEIYQQALIQFFKQ